MSATTRFAVVDDNLVDFEGLDHAVVQSLDSAHPVFSRLFESEAAAEHAIETSRAADGSLDLAGPWHNGYINIVPVTVGVVRWSHAD